MATPATEPPWHDNLLGNATEPLLYIVFALLAFCTLSGMWFLLLYALAGLVIFGVVLLYAVYLEYNVQRELERRRREELRQYGYTS